MTNVHSIKNFDPAQYEELDWYYTGDSAAMADAINYGISDEVWEALQKETDNFTYCMIPCQHCGTRHKYGAAFRHKPTEEIIFIGNICAGELWGLENKAQLMKRRLEKRATKEREKRKHEAQAQDILAKDPALAEAFKVDHRIINDIEGRLFQYGTISKAQRKLVLKIAREQDSLAKKKLERAVALEDVPAVTEGRQELEGVIVSTKVKESIYGSTLKMLVEADNGNRFWGTVPSSIENEDGIGGLRGHRIAFRGTVEPSDDDEHFAFFKRPSNAVLTPYCDHCGEAITPDQERHMAQHQSCIDAQLQEEAR